MNFLLTFKFFPLFRFIRQFQKIWNTTHQWDNKKLYKINLLDIFKDLLKNLKINLQPSYVWKIRTLNLWWPLLAMATFSFGVSFWTTSFCSIALKSKHSNHVWCSHNNTYHIKYNQCLFFLKIWILRNILSNVLNILPRICYKYIIIIAFKNEMNPWVVNIITNVLNV
jgi:hypothetical protein